ncbi:peptidylprolyl isomerase [Autumnicola edwardsiae]|uniref:peptidylprolyl isomerase n=1 Tax=Autumnicola edwardsiae TaxID=3075594 RepID=A0ABU3CU95_9FLAO|nr:peptidylprolyl isomerase [Zunongwangia sp. F297]MDT0649935.1 peptidylprolyl isomerase [Zunongwangia sp. F297]
MKKPNLLFLFAIALSLLSCNEEYPDLEDGLYAEFNTSKGPVVAELYFEQTPITVGSFVSLAEGENPQVDSTYKDKPFYDGIIFHRVIESFVIQGGDPTGTGSGGPGYRFPDETNDSLRHDEKGILSMANAGPGTNGSQFFITLAPTPNLDGRHTVFGKVVKGLDVVEAIGQVETGARDKPVEDVVINSVNIVRKGKEAKNFDAAETFETGLQDIEAEKQEAARKMEEAKAATAQELQNIEEQADSLDSGLKIYFEEKADGEKPEIGQTVGVIYEGYFTDGGYFDTNNEELAQELGVFNEQRAAQGGYGPMYIKYGPDAPMIPGFNEALQQMSVGDQAVVFIPSHLAYGERGRGPIPPNTDLVFRIEITDIQE